MFPVAFTFRETYIEQEQGENANDRNDRAIRVAAKWYNEHLKRVAADSQLQVILITNDRKNKEKAVQEGIPAFTCRSECGCFQACVPLYRNIRIRLRGHMTQLRCPG